MPSLLAQFSEDDDFLSQMDSFLLVIETNLNRLEQASDDGPALEEAYRSVHHIHSTASMRGVMSLLQVAHAMEDLFGDALDEVLHLDKAAFDLLHRSLERANLLLEVMKTGNGDAGRIVAEDYADHAAFRQLR